MIPNNPSPLYCSPGLDVLRSSHLDLVVEFYTMSPWLPQACNELVKEVKKRPGTDDTTVIVIHFEAP